MYMRDMGLSTEGLEQSVRLDRVVAIGPWEINLDEVEGIHAALSDNSELRRRVYDHVAGLAQVYIEKSTHQQAKHSPVAARRLASLAARDARRAVTSQ